MYLVGERLTAKLLRQAMTAKMVLEEVFILNWNLLLRIEVVEVFQKYFRVLRSCKEVLIVVVVVVFGLMS